MADHGHRRRVSSVALWVLMFVAGSDSVAQTQLAPPQVSPLRPPEQATVRRLPDVTAHQEPTELAPDEAGRSRPPNAHRLPPVEETVPTPDPRGVPAIAPREATAVWWERQIGQRMRNDHGAVSLRLEQLLVAALRHSPRIQAISDEPIIRRQAVVEADARFDPTAFMETKFARASDPVGNQLTVGPGGTRFRQDDWDLSGGVRKKNRLGGTFEAAQEVGTLNNNSQFLDPIRQGNSRLALSLNQPLLNGAGRQYNESLILLARLDEQATWSRTAEELQEHLTAVVEAYWELYAQRASLIQQRRHHQRGVEILSRLQARVGLDALQSQVLRARAAVATRRAALIRAETMIRNAESRLRALVAAPQMLADRQTELLPLDAPLTSLASADQHGALVTALEHRPEIDEAVQEVNAAGVRLEMSKSELLPVLDAVVEMYVAGLDGDYGIGQSLANQFSVGEPGYAAGFVFEFPIHNRAAQARYRRRIVQLRQLQNEFHDTVQTIAMEVEVAAREVETSHREMMARLAAVRAAVADVAYLQERWQLIPGEDRAASFVLEDLLDAQDRLADEEFRFVDAQRAYMVSLTTLREATGVLLQHEQIVPAELELDGVPRIFFDKTTATAGDAWTRPVQPLPVQPLPVQPAPTEPRTAARTDRYRPSTVGRAAP